MWANRMPRRVLPVHAPTCRSSTRAGWCRATWTTSCSSWRCWPTNYFHRRNYVTVGGRSYLSIFDSTFFVRELGLANARAQ
jgi:hypothetical protein